MKTRWIVATQIGLIVTGTMLAEFGVPNGFAEITVEKLPVPDREVLGRTGTEHIGQAFPEVDRKYLTLHSVTYLFSLQPEDGRSNRTYGISFTLTNTIQRTIADNGGTEVSSEGVMVGFSDGQRAIFCSRDHVISKYNARGKLVRSCSRAISQEPFEGVPGTDYVLSKIAPEFAKIDNQRVVDIANKIVLSRLNTLKPDDLRLMKLSYNWVVADLDGKTNELFGVILAVGPGRKEQTPQGEIMLYDTLVVEIDRQGKLQADGFFGIKCYPATDVGEKQGQYLREKKDLNLNQQVTAEELVRSVKLQKK